MQMSKRRFLRSLSLAVGAASVPLFLAGGCVAPRVSSAVSELKTQPWRCEYCGHLTRSDQDLTATRCPRCKRKGSIKKITEEELQGYLKQ